LLIFNGIASFILHHAALTLHVLPSIQKSHPHILSGVCIFIAFIQIIFYLWLKRWIFLSKEKGKRKK